MSFEQALDLIERNGGKIVGDKVTIKCQKPRAVRFEQSFPGLKPVERLTYDRDMQGSQTIEGDCAGIVFRGEVRSGNKDYVAKIGITIDGRDAGVMDMPASYQLRSLDIYWNFDLPQGKHKFDFRWLNPESGASVYMINAVLLSRTDK